MKTFFEVFLTMWNGPFRLKWSVVHLEDVDIETNS